MIKGIMSGPGINVQGGNTSFPYVPMNNNNPIQGMMRINGQDMQVFDGSSWLSVGASYATVELNADTQSILQWAREQRGKQLEWEQLAKTSKGVKLALDNLNKAEEQLRITAHLAKEQHETTS
jgi:hypothetical protein